MKKIFLACAFLCALSINSCKKDLDPIDASQLKVEDNKIVAQDILSWFDKVPVFKPAPVFLDDARQQIIDGKQVVRVPISTYAALYFTKEEGALKAYAYKWMPAKNSGAVFSGDIDVYNFQTRNFQRLKYDNGKIQAIRQLLSTKEEENVRNSSGVPIKTMLYIPILSEIFCWITGGHVIPSPYVGVSPECRYYENDDLGGGGGGGGFDIGYYVNNGYNIISGPYGNYGAGGTGGNGGGASWGPPSSPPCDPSGGDPVGNSSTRLKVNGSIGLGCPTLEDGQWQQFTILSNYQISDEFDNNINDIDPDDEWWDDNTLNFPAQTLPSYATLISNFPVDANNDEIPGPTVYANVGGDVQHIFTITQNPNACALRVSIALNKSGITIPNIPDHTFKGADGKYYFLSSAKLYNFMKKTFGEPTVKLSTADGGTNGAMFESKLAGYKGIFIMKAKSPTAFQAYGHATIYNGLGCVGGREHCYFNAKGGVSSIALWRIY